MCADRGRILLLLRVRGVGRRCGGLGNRSRRLRGRRWIRFWAYPGPWRELSIENLSMSELGKELKLEVKLHAVGLSEIGLVPEGPEPCVNKLVTSLTLFRRKASSCKKVLCILLAQCSFHSNSQAEAILNFILFWWPSSL